MLRSRPTALRAAAWPQARRSLRERVVAPLLLASALGGVQSQAARTWGLSKHMGAWESRHCCCVRWAPEHSEGRIPRGRFNTCGRRDPRPLLGQSQVSPPLLLREARHTPESSFSPPRLGGRFVVCRIGVDRRLGIPEGSHCAGTWAAPWKPLAHRPSHSWRRLRIGRSQRRGEGTQL